VVLMAIVAAGLLGIFSDGYLNAASIGEGDFSAQYDRFQRKSVTTRIRVNLPIDDDNDAHLMIGKSVLDTYDVDSIDPRPARAAEDQDNLTFRFDADGGRQLTAFIALRPRRAGLADVNLATPNRPPLLLRVLIYP
jgi:hypothetical protein